MADGEFDPEFEKLIQAQQLERAVHPERTPTQMAQRILEEAAAVAAMSIVNLSRTAQNEQLRMRASSYILDKVLGDAKTGVGAGKAWEGLLSDISIPDDVREIMP